ncbi:MAG TPA: hypothetical protein VEA58_14045, partial [Anaerovoracaceae bacterium]|nr:hypothetical protein [Anaerovoracaceae bacterium]
MKVITVFTFLLTQFCEYVHAQDLFIGLYGASYYQHQSGQLKSVKKNICIVYNSGYCMFYEQDRGASFFQTRNYSRSLQGEDLHTSFVSQETDVTPDGYFGVMIDENKDGIRFQVNFRNGQTYLVA